MADFGLKVVNANGFLQIDSTYANLGLRQKGSITSGGAATANGWYAATLTVAYGVSPMLAVRPASGQCVLVSTSVSGSNITYKFYCNASGVAITYWLFDSPAGITGSGSYGLIVRNSSGSPVFDSRMSYLRILDFINGTGTNVSLSTPYSKTIAVVQTQLWYSWGISTPPYPQTGGIVNFLAMPFAVSNNTFSASSGQLIDYSRQDPAPAINSTARNGYAYIIVDVTNM
ncbi:hypothetical protein [Caballeronia sp. GAFFF2]|uniref:hypothetical protein n=1 Tax=Caballeronia sp. GAFFF2 TaxID=2921741 RepID=UPI002027DEDE|nr:hypothetical protein [Caballeronia sp. GAFFF2]